jgi:hypothetical protein
VITFDHLRPPSPGDPSAPAYKEWLHVNLFDFNSGAVGLVNVSLHGRPGDSAARAVGAALVELPGVGWAGNLDVRAFDDAYISTGAIGLDRVAVGIDSRSGIVTASAQLPDHGLRVMLTAAVRGAAMIVDGPMPVGRGWIGWVAWPRLTVGGEFRVGETVLPLDNGSGYADHNWGRWYWGQDIGWEWGSFLCPDNGPTVVMSQMTDRAHRWAAEPLIELRAAGGRRRFTGSAVSIGWSGVLDVLPWRLPGAMAALHADRAAPRLPAVLNVQADDGIDKVEITFTARAAAQLILADPAHHGYSFLHELVGSFSCCGRLQGRSIEGEGLAVVERAE